MASKNKRKQTFKEEYSRRWDFIKPSRKGENHARCMLCSADFSIAASGRYDITRHIATAYLLWGIKCITMLVIKMRVIKWGKGSLFVYVFKKYRFLLKNTGLWASKYRFVFPEVDMSGNSFVLLTFLFFFPSFVIINKHSVLDPYCFLTFRSTSQVLEDLLGIGWSKEV